MTPGEGVQGAMLLPPAVRILQARFRIAKGKVATGESRYGNV
jgi:hypothetical protein